MIHFEPLQPDPLLKRPAPYSDGGLAKLAQVNLLVDHINGVIKGPVDIDATATATAEQIAHKVIKSTSLAATTITLPSAELIGSQLGVGDSVSFGFIIDNSAGANGVTLALGTGTTANPGSSLVTAAGSLGFFNIYFVDSATAIITRMA